MDAAPSTRPSQTVAHATEGSSRPAKTRQPGRRRRGRGGPRAYCALDGSWQLARGELMSRVAALPSRAQMQRPFPRSDLREGLGTFYDVVWKHARATHNAVVRTTWAQLMAACGYRDDVQAYRTLEAYARLLEEAALISVHGIKWDDGAWRCLEIVLHEPPALPSAAASPCSSTGRATPAWQALRTRESRSEREARREQPYRRRTGRADRVARFTFAPSSVSSARSNLHTPGSPPTPLNGLRPFGGGWTTQGHQRETRAGAPEGAGGGAAPDRRRMGPNEAVPTRRDRWAELEPLRTAALGEWGFDRLRAAADGGAAPGAVVVAAFNARFVADNGVWGWGPAAGDERPYLSAAWTRRLEVACRREDRLAGRAGAGVDQILTDMATWRPDRDGAAKGRRRTFSEAKFSGRDVAGDRDELGWPQSPAFFVSRLVRHSRWARRQADPRRQANHEAHEVHELHADDAAITEARRYADDRDIPKALGGIGAATPDLIAELFRRRHKTDDGDVLWFGN